MSACTSLKSNEKGCKLHRCKPKICYADSETRQREARRNTDNARQGKTCKLEDMTIMYLFYALGAIILVTTTANSSDENKKDDASHSFAHATFEIVSGRNSSGHWNSKLRFTHNANRGELEDDNKFNAWKMKFDQKIVVTEEGEMVSLYAVVTIPAADAAGIPTLSVDEPTVPPQPNYDTVISHGYKRTDGLGYYKFHDVPMTWYGALMKCQAETAHLIVINSEEEASLVRSLFLAHPTIYGADSNELAFVGVTDLENEGTYLTIFGEFLKDVGYNVWRQGQPNNYGTEPPGEDCMTADRESQYYDWECYEKLAFICEKEF